MKLIKYGIQSIFIAILSLSSNLALAHNYPFSVTIINKSNQEYTLGENDRMQECVDGNPYFYSAHTVGPNETTSFSALAETHWFCSNSKTEFRIGVANQSGKIGVLSCDLVDRTIKCSMLAGPQHFEKSPPQTICDKDSCSRGAITYTFY